MSTASPAPPARPWRERASNRSRRAVQRVWTPRVRRGLLGVVVLVVLIGALWLLPEWLLRSDLGNATGAHLARQPTLLDAYRQTVLKVLGGVIVGVGLYFTYRRLQQTDTTNRISEEGQVTERFTRAIEHLGSEHTAIQLGGIYALERIGRDSPKDHATVMEVLSAFIRENATEQANEPLYAEPVTDPEAGTITGYCIRPIIQAAVTVLGRRQIRPKEPQIDLRGVWLRQYDLTEANLERARLNKARFELSRLHKANLRNSILNNTNLEGAYLAEANIEGALFVQARLVRARLHQAHLEGALLHYANLEEAILYEAHFNETDLRDASLTDARLTSTYLPEARCSVHDFYGAIIDGVPYVERMPDPRTKEWPPFAAEWKVRRLGGGSA